MNIDTETGGATTGEVIGNYLSTLSTTTSADLLRLLDVYNACVAACDADRDSLTLHVKRLDCLARMYAKIEPSCGYYGGFWLNRLADFEEVQSYLKGERVEAKVKAIPDATLCIAAMRREAWATVLHIGRIMNPTTANVHEYFTLLGLNVFSNNPGDEKADFTALRNDLAGLLPERQCNKQEAGLYVWERLSAAATFAHHLLRAGVVSNMLPSKWSDDVTCITRGATFDVCPNLEYTEDLWRVIRNRAEIGNKMPCEQLILLRDWLVADCREGLRDDAVTVDAVHAVANLLDRHGLLTVPIADSIESLCTTKPGLQVVRSAWHILLAHLHWNSPTSAYRHAVAALKSANSAETKSTALWYAWSVAFPRSGTASELSDKRKSVVFTRVTKVCLDNPSIPLEDHIKWSLALMWVDDASKQQVSNSTDNPVADICADVIVSALLTCNPVNSDCTMQGPESPSVDDCCSEFVARYLDTGDSTKKQLLLDAAVGYVLRGGHDQWLGVALKGLVKCSGELAVIAKLAATCRDPRLQVNHIRALPLIHSVHFMLALLGDENVPSFASSLIHQGLASVLSRNGDYERNSAEAYIRGLVLVHASESVVRHAMSWPELQKPLWSRILGAAFLKMADAVLDNGYANTCIAALQEELGVDYESWVKLWVLELIKKEMPAAGEDACERLRSLLAYDLNQRLVARLRERAVQSEAEKNKAEIDARNQVIRDISHGVKNIVAAVVDPLDCLRVQVPEKKVVIEKALRGARLIREVINALNLSSRGSLKDFISDVEHAGANSWSLSEIVRTSLETACDNMFDTKFFVEYSRRYFPDEASYHEAHSCWQQGKLGNDSQLLQCLKMIMCDTVIDSGADGAARVGDAKGSRTKLLILIQELLLNAVKNAAFSERARRRIAVSISAVSGSLRLVVTNSYVPGTAIHSTRLGSEIVRNMATLLHGSVSVEPSGDVYSVIVSFPNIFSDDVRRNLNYLGEKANYESPVC